MAATTDHGVNWANQPSEPPPAKCDWANLLPELVGRVAGCLMLNYYLRFGAVCTSWRSVITQLSANGRRVHGPNRLQLPWLMMTGEEGESSRDRLTFISLPDGKSFTISSIPELRGGWWLGSGDGWLITLDAMGEMQLINPLTRRKIRLPPATTFPDVEAFRDESGVVEKYLLHDSDGGIVGNPYAEGLGLWTPLEFRIYQFTKVVSGWVFSNPPALVAMAIINPWKDLAFAIAGSESWAVIPSPNYYHDIIYINGQFFTVTAYGDIQVWELTGPSPSLRMTMNVSTSTHRIFENRYVKKYLVKSGTKLYQVWREAVGFLESGLYRTTAVEVMTISSSKKMWVRVESLGEQSFFLGVNQAVALSVPGLRKNCIYFTDDCIFSFFSEGHPLTCDMGVYSLEDRTYQPYYPPEQQVKWPEAMWFMPKMF